VAVKVDREMCKRLKCEHKDGIGHVNHGIADAVCPLVVERVLYGKESNIERWGDVPHYCLYIVEYTILNGG